MNDPFLSIQPLYNLMFHPSVSSLLNVSVHSQRSLQHGGAAVAQYKVHTAHRMLWMLTFGCSDSVGLAGRVCPLCTSVCVHVSTGLARPGPSLGLAQARAGADLRLWQQTRFSLGCRIQLTRGPRTGHCVSLARGAGLVTISSWSV